MQAVFFIGGGESGEVLDGEEVGEMELIFFFEDLKEGIPFLFHNKRIIP